MSDCTCVRGDDGQVRVPRSRCPQHGWADAPTPSQALADEQIDRDISELRIQHGPAIDRFIAAVIDRAKREAAEEIAQAIERESATLDHLPPTGDPGIADYRMGLGHGMAGSAEHDLIGAAGIARRIGATR